MIVISEVMLADLRGKYDIEIEKMSGYTPPVQRPRRRHVIIQVACVFPNIPSSWARTPTNAPMEMNCLGVIFPALIMAMSLLPSIPNQYIVMQVAVNEAVYVAEYSRCKKSWNQLLNRF